MVTNNIDARISKSLKKWASQQEAPADGKTRLLNSAAQNASAKNAPTKTLIYIIKEYFSPAAIYGHPLCWNQPQPAEWAQGLFDWEMVCRLNFGTLSMKTLL